MEIHLSEKFSCIEIVRSEAGLIVVRSYMWPSWDDLYQATKEELTHEQLCILEDLFTNNLASRDFEIVDGVLKFRLT